MKEFLDFVKQKKWKKWKKDQWLILFLAGILLLVIAFPTNCDDKDASGTENKEASEEEFAVDSVSVSSSDYQALLEEKLENALSQMEGVGEVKVMITLRDGGETVVEKDVTYSETDQETEDADGNRTADNQRESSEETVYSPESDDGEPLVSKEITPTIEGVLVIAQGGGDSTVAVNISEAVEALFGLDAHKIKVVKMYDGQEGSD